MAVRVELVAYRLRAEGRTQEEVAVDVGTTLADAVAELLVNVGSQDVVLVGWIEIAGRRITLGSGA